MYKILIVSLFDDNFGDNLIRICFESLLKVVLKNLNISKDRYQINKMPLKNIDADLIINSDYIFFPGGGLFGLSYLNFYEYIDEITILAEQNDIPVFFSSLGINNMGAKDDDELLLKKILSRRCIKSISVRENINEFKKYSENIKIEQVCDPAVWTKYVYNTNNAHKNNIIGINVVRGGLFKDNGKNWSIVEELEYLYELKVLMDEANLKYIFYTNGSSLDDNALRHFVKEYNILEEQVSYPHTTKELVETISKFSAAVTFRMHSSIIAYSFGIPSISLSWNDKIPFFYQNINYPERALEINDWNSTVVFNKLNSILLKDNIEKDKKYEEYSMSLYANLYSVVLRYILNKEETNNNNMYDFNKVINTLSEDAVDINEDEFDLRFKIGKTEERYFRDLAKKKVEITKFKRENQKRKNMIIELERENQERKDTIIELERENQKRKDTIIKLKAKNESRRDTIIKLRAKNESKRDTIVKLKAKNENKRDTIIKLRAKNEKQKNKIIKLTTQNQKQKDELARLNKVFIIRVSKYTKRLWDKWVKFRI